MQYILSEQELRDLQGLPENCIKRQDVLEHLDGLRTSLSHTFLEYARSAGTVYANRDTASFFVNQLRTAVATFEDKIKEL